MTAEVASGLNYDERILKWKLPPPFYRVHQAYFRTLRVDHIYDM